MAGTGRKWLIGCGIGCGLLVVVAGGIGTCGYLGVKKIADRADGLDEGFDALEEVYGAVEDYQPEADGTIPADRLDVFLAVRDDLAPVRDDLGAMFATLDKEGGGGFIAKIKAGMNFVPRLFDFVEARNRILADRAMGLGEYTYIYSIAYHSWLEKPLTDGPSFRINGDDNDDDSGVRWGFDERESEVLEQREEDLRRFLHRVQRSMLDHQLAAAERLALDEVWLAELRAESAAMDDRKRRLLWEDGVPDPLRDSLEPFRESLEASYVPVMNAVELGIMDHD
jgi:hypothetical protein